MDQIWNVELLNELMGESVTEEIVQTKIPGHNGLDICVWKPSLDGRFTAATAWDATREKRDQLPWHEWFWNKSLPKKVSMCNWRAWFQSLATDERVQNKGISLATACDCCVPKARESIDHVLVKSQIASRVWEFASRLLKVPCLMFNTWKAKISAWLICAKKSSLVGNLIGLLPSIITWCLWTRRCKVRMEELKISAIKVWTSMKMWLKKMAADLKVHRQLYKQDLDLLYELNLEMLRLVTRKCRLVTWSRPLSGWIKLNCDGSCRNNPGSSGGGGILRDMDENFKAAFSAHFGLGTNNGAELRAMLEGIRLCKSLIFSKVIIESDSKLIVDWFRTGLFSCLFPLLRHVLFAV
ncbi:hypothetical protein Ddye_023028 [Dipteronia dyeriana]|uniref:RNase H type-1 domain-containing protein n=1 Tax=Dipteronia dyeriana TaxID=168575 RepID=A0AAD9WT02_9ROSI|nr:hypothetical protein Ddye_023028 [Dipteronia dyeriana]